jgi:hypothetical protein
MTTTRETIATVKVNKQSKSRLNQREFYNIPPEIGTQHQEEVSVWSFGVSVSPEPELAVSSI